MQAGHETREPERSGSLVGFYDCCHIGQEETSL